MYELVEQTQGRNEAFFVARNYYRLAKWKNRCRAMSTERTPRQTKGEFGFWLRCLFSTRRVYENIGRDETSSTVTQ